jgi:hypothetical protein
VPVVPFGGELGTVDADRDQHIAVALFELPQLRKYVETVDSAVGPEIEQDELAAQVAQRQRSCNIDPIE